MWRKLCPMMAGIKAFVMRKGAVILILKGIRSERSHIGVEKLNIAVNFRHATKKTMTSI